MYWQSGRLLAVYYTSLRRAPLGDGLFVQPMNGNVRARRPVCRTTVSLNNLGNSANKQQKRLIQKKLLELTQAINRIFEEREKANGDLARRALGS